MIKKVIIYYYQNVWNKRDFRLLDHLVADNCRVNYINGPLQCTMVKSVCDIRKYIEHWTRIYPDLRVEILKLVCDKEYVSAYYRFEGTDRNLRHIYPAEQMINKENLTIFKISGGKICEQLTTEVPVTTVACDKYNDAGR